MAITRQENTTARLLMGNNEFQADTFDAAGVATYPAGTVLGRATADGKLEDWDPVAVDGTENPVAILVNELTTAAGDNSVRVCVSGNVRADGISIYNGGTPLALTKAQYDLLRDYGIIPHEDEDLLRLDN